MLGCATVMCKPDSCKGSFSLRLRHPLHGKCTFLLFNFHKHCEAMIRSEAHLVCLLSQSLPAYLSWAQFYIVVTHKNLSCTRKIPCLAENRLPAKIPFYVTTCIVCVWFPANLQNNLLSAIFCLIKLTALWNMGPVHFLSIFCLHLVSVVALVSLSKKLYHNCPFHQMGHQSVVHI